MSDSKKVKNAASNEEERKGKRESREKDSEKQNSAGKETAGSSKSAKTDDTGLKEIMTQFMKSVNASLKRQEDKITTIYSRVDDMDKAWNEGYAVDDGEYFGEEHGVPPPTASTSGADEVGLGDRQSQTTTSKRSIDDEVNEVSSRFSQMSKKFKTQDVVDENIDSVLASNVTDLFRNGIDDERYKELVKDENNARPENCEGLVTVHTNQMIWDGLSPSARTNDKKLQNVATSVIKAATILVKTVNKMAILENEAPKYGEMIESCQDVLALLGHTNKQVNFMRRDFLKPEIKDEYAHLCNHTMPYSKELFGDDVSKTAKEIEDIAKISNKINRNYRGRGRLPYRPSFRYRGRGRGMPSRGRSFGNMDYEAKNYPPRRGGMTRPLKRN